MMGEQELIAPPEVQAQLNEAVVAFGRRFRQVLVWDPKWLRLGDPGPSVAPSGAPYITMTSGGEKEQGHPQPVRCRYPGVAIHLWSLVMQDRFPSGGDDILVWREWPSVYGWIEVNMEHRLEPNAPFNKDRPGFVWAPRDNDCWAIISRVQVCKVDVVKHLFPDAEVAL